MEEREWNGMEREGKGGEMRIGNSRFEREEKSRLCISSSSVEISVGGHVLDKLPSF